MITAHVLKGDGTSHAIKIYEISKFLKIRNTTVWVDIEQPSEDEYNLILNRTFNFHPLSISQCKMPLELPKIDLFDDYLFLVFHNVSSDAEKGYFKKSEVDFFLGENYLVSVHQHKSKTVDYLIEKLASGKGLIGKKIAKINGRKKKKISVKTSDFLLYEILDNFIDRYFPLIDAWDEEIEDLETSIISNKAPSFLLNRLMIIKREILTMRKSIMPQREVLKKLHSVDFPFIRKKSSFYFKDLYDHIARVYSELEVQRDMANSAFQAQRSMEGTQMNIISNNINRVMQKLTIMSAIFMPLTFITGLYGMNFDYIPGAKHPLGFFAVLMASLIMSGVMLQYFKRNDWM